MQHIRNLRKNAKVSATKLAEQIGVTVSAIYHYETNRRTPDLKQCWEIVKALNELGVICSFDDVFPNPNHD